MFHTFTILKIVSDTLLISYPIDTLINRYLIPHLISYTIPFTMSYSFLSWFVFTDTLWIPPRSEYQCIEFLLVTKETLCHYKYVLDLIYNGKCCFQKNIVSIVQFITDFLKMYTLPLVLLWGLIRLVSNRQSSYVWVVL